MEINCNGLVFNWPLQMNMTRMMQCLVITVPVHNVNPDGIVWLFLFIQAYSIIIVLQIIFLMNF